MRQIAERPYGRRRCACGRGTAKGRDHCARCLLEQPDPIEGPRWDLSCPHCVPCWPRPATCCVCQATRRVSWADGFAAIRSAWARPGCACATCETLRPRATRVPSAA